MQKIYRLTQRGSFTYVYKKSVPKHSPLLTLYSVPAHNLKIGVVVGKKVGNSVVRSRVKRRISERFRLLIPFVDHNRNYVVVAKSSCADATSVQINEELVSLLKKCSFWVEQ